MAQNYYNEEEENIREESLNNYKYLFTDYEKNMPTLNDALYQMFNSEINDYFTIRSLINDIIIKCKQTIDNKINEINQKYKNISINQAYIICSYTCESFQKY